jgi:hypothetical protein
VPAVLALGLVAAGPGTGSAEATRARPAAPLALGEPAASAACWLWGDAADLLAELACAVLTRLAPPADGALYLIADTTLRGKTGQKQPLAHPTRLHQHEPFVFGHCVLLVLAHGGRRRIPVGAVVLDAPRQGQQNIPLRRLWRPFQPPRWRRRVVALAAAGLASKAKRRAIQRRGGGCVFGLPRPGKRADGRPWRDWACPLPQGRCPHVASSRPDRRRRDDWTPHQLSSSGMSCRELWSEQKP